MNKMNKMNKMNNMNNMQLSNSSNNGSIINSALSNADDLIPGTTWTWADAAAMQKDILRDQRIERSLNRKPRRKSAKAQAPVSSMDTLEAETGWSPADATDEAFEARSDFRRYGRTRIYS